MKHIEVEVLSETINSPAVHYLDDVSQAYSYKEILSSSYTG
jgi:hypothetical protein